MILPPLYNFISEILSIQRSKNAEAFSPSGTVLNHARNYLQSPYLFMCANLCNADLDNLTPLASQTVLSGTLVSSLHRLKDVDNMGKCSMIVQTSCIHLHGTLDGGFFVFGDLSVTLEGDYRLRFSLFEMLK